MVKNKQIIIGHLDLEFREHLNQSYTKLKVLNDLLFEFNEVIGCYPLDMKTFNTSAIDQAVNYIKDKHSEGLTLGLELEKFMSLYGYDLKRLRAIKQVLDNHPGTIMFSNGDWLVNDRYNDFAIVVNSADELARYNDAKELVDSLNKIYSKYLTSSGTIRNGINVFRFIQTNLETGEYFVNPSFVKQY